MNYNEPGQPYSGYSSGGNNRPPSRMPAFFPLLFAVMLILGVLLGYNIRPGGAGMSMGSDNKLGYIINLIDNEYVDTVNSEALIDKAITGMLDKLDPHSVYLSARDVKSSNEELSGKFGGIGIQFIILDDTLMVTHLVKDGPSEKKGLKPFDRILMVDNKKFSNIKLTNDTVQSHLKGDINTQVRLRVFRPSEKRTFDITINRGIIPVSSIECSFVLANNTGFIHILQFGEDTYRDFLQAARRLKEQGMKRIIVDLRDNGGGYLQAAQNIADQFLKEGMMIVYTNGAHQGRHEYKATTNGEMENIPVVIMVNDNSASASEILAGAIQDNDRGVIVGRRTFGKGLVQQQFNEFRDGSALRLTVARYYTPSGRSIQRPYGDGIDYYHDRYQRYINNELFRPDSSIFVDSLRYTTIVKKRTVYGGGGIMPDVFVPFDTSFASNFQASALRLNCVNAYAFRYVETHLQALKMYPDFVSFHRQFNLTQPMWDAFVAYCLKKGVEAPKAGDIARSRQWLSNLIKAEIARLALGNEAYYYVRMNYDTDVKEALGSFWK